MTALAMLQAARERLSRPERWTQGALARSQAGAEVFGYDPAAVCWCVRGALEAVPGSLEDYAEAVRRYERAVGARCLEDWNDAPERTHTDILSGFAQALAEEPS